MMLNGTNLELKKKGKLIRNNVTKRNYGTVIDCKIKLMMVERKQNN